MTDVVASRDAYERAVETVVRAVEGEIGGAPLVVLDRTVFYPGGGGQPSDTGLLLRAADGRRWTVTGAKRAGADVAHVLDAGVEPPAPDRKSTRLNSSH